MIGYNPANWYWIVAGDAAQLWSSAAAAYVPPGDATYQAWLAAGNAATQIDSEASLADVLQAQAPAGLGVLASYLPVVLTFLQFMALFTPAEQAALVGSADTQTKLFVMMATGAGSIALANPEVVAGVNYLATPATATPPGPGLIASARVAQILANQAPS
jgi:hypothetical protein